MCTFSKVNTQLKVSTQLTMVAVSSNSMSIQNVFWTWYKCVHIYNMTHTCTCIIQTYKMSTITKNVHKRVHNNATNVNGISMMYMNMAVLKRSTNSVVCLLIPRVQCNSLYYGNSTILWVRYNRKQALNSHSDRSMHSVQSHLPWHSIV